MDISAASTGAQPFIITPKAYAPALNVLGVNVTVLATNVATRSYEVTLQQGDVGTGPPAHSHHWDESFYVLKGTVEFTCAGQTQTYAPGTFVHVPARTVHAFRFGEHGGEMLEMTGQGGFATQMFTAVNNEFQSGMPDLPKVLEVLKRNGVIVST